MAQSFDGEEILVRHDKWRRKHPITPADYPRIGLFWGIIAAAMWWIFMSGAPEPSPVEKARNACVNACGDFQIRECRTDRVWCGNEEKARMLK